VRVVASEPAADLIREQGGRLYVWPRRGRCCGAVTTLAAATHPPGGKEFRRVDRGDEFELYFPAALARVPDELHVDLRRFPRRVVTYWDGCAWVV
jgi:hypothetical protein